MTPDDIKNAVEVAIGNQVVLSYPQLIIFVVLSGVAAFVGAYLKQKAVGLATKEDIAVLTQSAEEIKARIKRKAPSSKGSCWIDTSSSSLSNSQSSRPLLRLIRSGTEWGLWTINS